LTQQTRYFLFLMVLSFCGFSAHAQTSTDAGPPTPDYSKEAVVTELTSVKVNFENDGTSTQEVTLRARIQSDAGVQRYGLLTFTYQGATQTIEVVYLRVRKPDGAKCIKGSDKLEDAGKYIRAAIFPLSYPDGSKAHVVRRGMLSCSAVTGCSIVLYTPDQVTSVN
jgi:uncharacterized protein DUF3857